MHPIRSPAQQNAISFTRMRVVATGLLLAMSALYGAAVTQHGPGWAYLRAFAEAAMVGGLADWFAVTAIFRRPFGLPIPHTAVIPRNKNRIADALGEFVTVNFLAPAVVAQRLEKQDLATALAGQLAEPHTARRFADGVIDAAPSILDLLDDDVVADFLKRQLAEFSHDARLASAIGQGIKLLTDQGRHQPVLDAALIEGWRALEDHEPAIRAQVSARTNWLLRLVSVDARAADALINAIEDTLRAIARDPNHPARQRVTELLQRFAHDLQTDPDLRARVEQIVADILTHPAVASYLGALGKSLKDMLRTGAQSDDSVLRAAFADALARMGAALLADAEVRVSLNVRLRALLVEVSGRHGGDVSRLISDTIRSWDTATVVEKLEQNVGRDLQYIRINGTLIGGLVGLAIHQLTIWLT
ncbi:MAG TPA: DUF445 domain-containing protein [Caulobacterales bacterium]|nr:DUF445 domain-containing protein [Caulobacterales bacterium]